MKKLLVITMLAVALFTATSALAGADPDMGARLDKAAAEVANAYSANDPTRLSSSLERLVVVETMWLGLGGSPERSYLRSSPLPQNASPRQIAAWVWLTRLKREQGVGCLPADFFAGKTFQVHAR